MPEKYVIHAKNAPPRFRPIGKFGIIDWREDCSSCHNCVKKSCVFDLYKDENTALHDEHGYLDYIYQCKGCMQCIQNCTKNLLSRMINPEYTLLGDDYYTPEVILTTWFQAEAGRIPVSGSGYGGKFSGKGFDSMWTDMSEIVRPTRDGIHGREYINTSVDIGGKLNHLEFDGMNLVSKKPLRIESPVPIIFNMLPEHFQRGEVMASLVSACQEMGTYMIMRAKDINNQFKNIKNIIPFIENNDVMAFPNAGMIIIPDNNDIFSVRDKIKSVNNSQIVAVEVKASKLAKERIMNLVKNGIEVINLSFNSNGMEFEDSNPRHMRDVLRDIHPTLVKAGLRDQLFIIASRGIALAEHVPKAMICGADSVAIDIPLVIALECRLCGECQRGEECQIKLEDIKTEYGKNRIINLIHAWRNQILEMLGAMGIREVRRLRGEMGRAMFFEDLERETFGSVFGKRKK